MANPPPPRGPRPLLSLSENITASECEDTLSRFMRFLCLKIWDTAWLGALGWGAGSTTGTREWVYPKGQGFTSLLNRFCSVRMHTLNGSITKRRKKRGRREGKNRDLALGGRGLEGEEKGCFWYMEWRG